MLAGEIVYVTSRISRGKAVGVAEDIGDVTIGMFGGKSSTDIIGDVMSGIRSGNSKEDMGDVTKGMCSGKSADEIGEVMRGITSGKLYKEIGDVSR